MRAGRPGFALILVLLAAAAAFALVLQGAVVSRATTLESRIIRERAAAERDARAAVIIALSGLMSARNEEREADALAESSKPGGAGDSDAPQNKKPDLPPIIRQLLGEQGEEIDKKAKEQQSRDGATQAVADGGGLAGQSGSVDRFKALQSVGLPAGAVEFGLSETDSRRFRVAMWDAAGQLSINAASEAQLARFLTAKGIDAQLAARLADEIADWRDEDTLRRALGAEDDHYRAKGLRARNAPFVSLEEMLYLPSMTREVFERVRADLTLSGDKKCHIGSCSREVLLSLPGVGAEFADRVMEARRQGPITAEWVARYLPIAARDAEPLIRTELGNIIGFTVEMRGDTIARFEGLAVMGDNGIKSIALRAM